MVTRHQKSDAYWCRELEPGTGTVQSENGSLMQVERTTILKNTGNVYF